MRSRTVLYGNIADAEALKGLLESVAGEDGLVLHRDAPSAPPSDSVPTTVFVDLDDPQFADSDFLLSLSSGAPGVTLIGKASQMQMEDTKRVAKLGVSEVLSADQCLLRLKALLAEAEQVGPRKVPAPSKHGVGLLIGRSEQMGAIRDTIALLGEVDFPSALILGETGTGKSLISKVLHHSGVRAKHNLVEVNCSAIPDELFESELFGHIKGAFTDAKSEKQGLFEYAEGGTLFLDEVGNLSAPAQAKLLKILEDKKLRKVGAVNEQDINVRVVAATNLNLQEAISAGRFREDLFFRLNLLTIDIPPLRQRPADVIELAEHYLGYYATNYGKRFTGISEAAKTQMSVYEWPGNVRQLCNIIERAVLLGKGPEITETDIDLALKNGRISLADRQQLVIDLPAHGIALDTIEQRIVGQVLNMFDWNKSAAAEFLGISRPRLRRIIEAAGLVQDRRKV
jgi:DNA-binding NtrC family response regulator